MVLARLLSLWYYTQRTKENKLCLACHRNLHLSNLPTVLTLGGHFNIPCFCYSSAKLGALLVDFRFHRNSRLSKQLPHVWYDPFFLFPAFTARRIRHLAKKKKEREKKKDFEFARKTSLSFSILRCAKQALEKIFLGWGKLSMRVRFEKSFWRFIPVQLCRRGIIMRLHSHACPWYLRPARKEGK